MSANIGSAIMPANAKLLHSQPSRQIWLGGRNARGMYAEDIGKIQKKSALFSVPPQKQARGAIKNYFQFECRRITNAWQ
jgi:hypothetical protein